jgi:alkylated DNA repair dioxygenase AlkB
MTELIENLLSIDEANAALNALRPNGNEIEYGQYYALTNDHSLVRLPRLMAFQASMNSSGDFPWYRCTMSSVPQNKINYMPWTLTVQKIKDLIEQRTGETWNLAHIIYYKDGEDSMGMHSDTMLDLASGSKIAVVSFGSTRQLDLLKKHKSTSDGPSQIKFDLPGNSLFLLDEETNKNYVHGIKKTRKNEIEDRIAIVFRHVVTFKTDNGKFYGQGSAFLTKQAIIQRETQRKIFQYLSSFLLAAFIIWLFPIFSTSWLKLITGGIFWFFISMVIKQIEQIINNYMNKISNERLQKLCQIKNFQIWDQTNMRHFLKYS